MSREEYIVYLPDRLVFNNISELVRKLNFMYGEREKNRPNVYLVLRSLKDIDILGILILYKFMDFSIRENCFKSPNFHNEVKSVFNRQVKKYGFDNLISECYKDRTEMKRNFDNLKVEIKGDFLIAPIAIKSEENINKNALKQIEAYYTDENTCSIVFSFFSELHSNFNAHSNDTSRSVIVAYGNKDYVEISCADSGDGIITSMRNLYDIKDDCKLLRKAMSEGVTSKPSTNHMGYGLWLLNEIVKLSKGQLMVYSQTACYINRFGKESLLSVPNWKGTMVYVKLNLKDLPTLKDVYNSSNLKNKINVNFV